MKIYYFELLCEGWRYKYTLSNTSQRMRYDDLLLHSFRLQFLKIVRLVLYTLSPLC